MKHVLAFLLLLLAFSNCSCQLCQNFDPIENITASCMDQLKIVCSNTSVLWQFFDASSKYPISGLSYATGRDFGNFDECITIDHGKGADRVLGKYCMFSMAVILPTLNGGTKQAHHKTIDHHNNLAPFISELGQSPDLGDLEKAAGGKAYIQTVLSTCVPDACTPAEVAKFFVLLDELPIVVFPSNPICQTKDTNKGFTGGDIAFITFLSIIGLLMVCSTIYDIYLERCKQESRHPLFLAFSVYTNGSKLFQISYTKNAEQILCLNGLRFISMMWVICGHGFAAYQAIPLINADDLDKMKKRLASQYVESAPIAVDTFFFLSGMLSAYSYVKSSHKLTPVQQLINWPKLILHRYIRLTPACAIMFFVAVTIFHFLGSGPMFPNVVAGAKDQCEKHWWAFFLYVQNYVNDADMCLNHTWYLSADMQMFLLSPLVLIPAALYVKKNLKLVIFCLVVLTVICVGFPMGIRFADHYITNVYDTHSRLNDYLIGIIIGIILRETKDKPFPFTRIQNFIIWVVVLLACLAFNLYYSDVVNYYEHTEDTLFYGLYRPVWCASLAWMIYSCYYGYGGIVNWILTWRVFQVGARLSYSMYLIHAVVIFHWVGILKTPVYLDDWNAFYAWCGHFTVTTLLSVVLCLGFESPMIIIEKFIFGGGAPKRKAVQTAPAKVAEA